MAGTWSPAAVFVVDLCSLNPGGERREGEWINAKECIGGDGRRRVGAAAGSYQNITSATIPVQIVLCHWSALAIAVDTNCRSFGTR